MELPKSIVKAIDKNPKRLFIFSNPKVGKTSLVAELCNCLLVDVERGSGFVDALKVQANTLEELSAVANQIKADNDACGGFAYDYIALDTVTGIEDLAKTLALKLYQKTAMGKNFTGNVLSLPNGGGYGYLREAFEIIYKKFDGLSKCLILLGHLKKASITKEGKEITA
jgi:hypothetical protein